MLILRLKIIIFSALAILLSTAFVLYKVDLFNKERNLANLKHQISGTAKTAFDLAYITGEGVSSHAYDIINSVKVQKEIDDLWISRSDDFSAEIGKSRSNYRDQAERNVYISKQNSEEPMRRIEGTNDHRVRVSFPIIANEQCLVCHLGTQKGDVIGAVNASIWLKDNIYDIITSMETEFLAFVIGAPIIMMIILMFSIKSFSAISESIKEAIISAINGDFTRRVQSKMIGTDELAKLINKLLESVDKNLTAIDTRIATIFIYNRLLYNKNPLIRLSDVMNEVVALYNFKNKIDSYNKTNDIYKEIQAAIQKYIKYKNLIFAELVNNEIISGCKIENDTTMKVMAGEINSIEKRLNDANKNIIYGDEKGSVFISTSTGGLHAIDLRFVVSDKLSIYYSIILDSKRELAEKEKSITRIYNYMREARHIINNKMLMHEIEESSYTDPLTKAYNRFFLDRHSAKLKEKLEKHISIGVLMLDIDHFKNINDTYGHAVGDAGIVLLVETIRKIIRPIDKLVRYGGEEFVVILDSADMEEAKRVAEKIRTAFAMAKKCSRGELNFNKSVSIGASVMPDFSKDIWECINQADTALYEAKEGGRNRVVPYSNEVQARANAKNEAKKNAANAGVASGGVGDASASGVATGENPSAVDVEHNDDDDFEASLRMNNQI